MTGIFTGISTVSISYILFFAMFFSFCYCDMPLTTFGAFNDALIYGGIKNLFTLFTTVLFLHCFQYLFPFFCNRHIFIIMMLSILQVILFAPLDFLSIPAKKHKRNEVKPVFQFYSLNCPNP